MTMLRRTMSVVYRVRDKRNGTDFAVKLVNLEKSESEIVTFQVCNRPSSHG